MTKIKFAFAMVASVSAGVAMGVGGTNLVNLLTYTDISEAPELAVAAGLGVDGLRGSIIDFGGGLSPMDEGTELDFDRMVEAQLNAGWSCKSMGFDGGYLVSDDRVECFSPTAVVFYPNDIYDELSAKGQLVTDALTIMRGHKECQALGFSGGYFENVARDSLKCGNVYEEELVSRELYKELAERDVFFYARFYAQEYAACLDIGLLRPLVYTVVDEADGTVFSFCAEEEQGLSIYRGYSMADLNFVLPADGGARMPIISTPIQKAPALKV